jgi:hypothetical protein
VWATGKRLAVYSIREARSGKVWVRAGHAFVNRDDSLNVYLDVLPLDGTLHVREPGEKRVPASDGPLPAPLEPAQASLALLPAEGGH